MTDRPPYLMRAADGTFVEVFEWKSAAAVEAAHGNSAVQAMWARFEEACTYESLLNLKETKEMFANFEAVRPLNLVTLSDGTPSAGTRKPTGSPS